MELNVEQVRNFRLHAHHLDTFYAKADVLAAVGACGMQNTPPGAWEAALFNRVPACKAADRDRLLLEERSLDLRFRGSENQRIIDMNRTRAAGRIVLWEGMNGWK